MYKKKPSKTTILNTAFVDVLINSFIFNKG